MADSKEDWKRKDEGDEEEEDEVDESVCATLEQILHPSNLLPGLQIPKRRHPLRH